MIADLNQVLFLDIETVPAYRDISKAPQLIQDCWKDKMKSMNLEKYMAEVLEMFGGIAGEESVMESALVQHVWIKNAALHPEFSEIACISVGKYQNKKVFDKQTFFNIGEHFMLDNLAKFLNSNYKGIGQYGFGYLCAYNGKQFDFPFLAKRYIVNRLKLPAVLNTFGKKPWEITQFIDPWEIWKFSGQASCSLRTLEAILNGTDCKDEMDGSEVMDVYYNYLENADEQLKERIITYCEKDIYTLFKVFWRLNELV